MTVQCIRCKHLSLKDAGPQFARLGLGLCSVHSNGSGHMHSATYERVCPEFKAAATSTVAKRQRLLDDEQPTLV